jgi:hypothetical protein
MLVQKWIATAALLFSMPSGGLACPGHEHDKEPIGLRVSGINQGSLYERAGLMEGDTIKEINGVALVDTAEAIKIFNSLKDEDKVKVRRVRGGKVIEKILQLSKPHLSEKSHGCENKISTCRRPFSHRGSTAVKVRSAFHLYSGSSAELQWSLGRSKSC